MFKPADSHPQVSSIALTIMIGLWSAGISATAEEIDYSRDVLPILANKCFVCHGPDSHPDTDLRLDEEMAATQDRGGFRAIDRQHPAQSELLIRISDSADPMPPVDAEKQLTAKERQVLTEWIKEGGEYESHWAWVAPSKQLDYPHPSSAIDALVTQQLKKNGLTLSKEASRATLARRVSLVLTGLPPQQEWIDRFLWDDSEDAYETFVDRLLASPAYGEHQARYWLDAVRYGDTHGLHLDNRRGIYPYRDWVVRALNNNLPIDQFITWQLAGDLLDSPSLDQQLATGFIRMNPSTGEGGAIAEEFQMKNNFDRVETFGTVFLGLSLTCARCHTHKYDPIEQREYYELLAFFNNTNESALDGNSYTYGTTIEVPSDQNAWNQWSRLNADGKQIIEQQLQAAPANILTELSTYAAETNHLKLSDWKSSLSNLQQRNLQQPNQPPQEPPALELSTESKPIQGFPGRLTAKQAGDRLPTDQQVMELSVVVETKIRQTIDVEFSGAAGSQLMVRPQTDIQQESKTTESPRVAEYETVITKPDNTGICKTSVDTQPGKHQYWFNIIGVKDMDAVTVQINNRWIQLASNQTWDQCDLTQQLQMAADPNGPLHDALSAQQSADLSKMAEDKANKLLEERSRFTTSLVAAERSKPRITRMLRRGEYDAPVGEELSPSTPAILGGWSTDFPSNRLGLARWVTSESNPLVSRVLVNRIWQRVFGVGLVRTPEDFGVQGQQATHPELLDWLAVDFMESGWDLKEILRAMVTSKTFRQSSNWRPNLDDPENRLLARASSYRLDAEVLRDLGLYVSQQLDPVMGGEGIKPYQPDGMWAALAHPASNTKKYQSDADTRRNRRSLYVYWKRTSPHPMMTLFDAPDRESSCVRRSRTNTPLQSLGMLNETQRVEIGRAFAEHLIGDAVSDDVRIKRMFETVTCRPPNTAETNACLKLLSDMRSRYQESKEDAEQLLSVGQSKKNPDLATSDAAASELAASELAAWTVLTTTFLASDLAIMLY